MGIVGAASLTPRINTLQYLTFWAAKDVGPYVIPFPKLP